MSHAILSPSAASRWIQCPGSVRLSKHFEDESSSPYAEEGTRAHVLAEFTAAHRFGLLSDEEYSECRAAWRLSTPDPEQRTEMERHVATYVALLAGLMTDDTQLLLEQRVDTGIPHCWGTADAVIVSPVNVHVVDLKYGRGVRVRAEDNPQLKLYGLGALNAFDVLGTIETVSMSIFQPRLGEQSTVSVSADDLRAWGEEIRPVALAALDTEGWFAPSEAACRFCPAAGECKPRMQYLTGRDFGDPDLMSADDLGEALSRSRQLRAWVTDVESAALERMYSRREPVPGFKVVRSSGRRAIADQPHAIQTLIDHGYPAESVARLSLKPLGELEKLLTREGMTDLLGDFIVKPEGRPVIAPDGDNRPAISPETEAVKDFTSLPD